MTVIGVRLVSITGAVIAATDASDAARRLVIAEGGTVEGHAVTAEEFGWSGSLTVRLPDVLRDAGPSGPIGPLASTEAHISLVDGTTWQRVATMMIDDEPEIDRDTGVARLELRGKERTLSRLSDNGLVFDSADFMTVQAMLEQIALAATAGGESLVGGLSGFSGAAHIAKPVQVPAGQEWRGPMVELAGAYGLTPFFDHAGVFVVAGGVQPQAASPTGFAFDAVNVADWEKVAGTPSAVRVSGDSSTQVVGAHVDAAFPEFIDWRDPYHSSFGSGRFVDREMVGDDGDVGLAVQMIALATRAPHRLIVRLTQPARVMLRSVGWVNLGDQVGKHASVAVGYSWRHGGAAPATTVELEQVR